MRYTILPMVSSYTPEDDNWAAANEDVVFIVFKSKVDMTAFRSIAGLASDTPRALLRDPVYLPEE